MENVLFGIFPADEGLTVKRLKTDNATQGWLVSEFQNQCRTFLHYAKEEKEFDAHGVKHNDELYWIGDFPDKSLLEQVLTSNADAFEEFSKNDFQDEKPKALGMVLTHNSTKHICFQLFDQRNVLAGKNIVGLNGNTLTKNNNYLISLSNSVVVIYSGGRLKFKSFYNAKRIFDLKSFYIELSNDEIEEVVENIPTFTWQDKDHTFKKLNERTRKLFSALSLDDHVKSSKPEDLASRVKQDVNIDLVIDKGQLCLPKDPKTLYVVLHSMLGNVFEDGRTQQKNIATAKELLEKVQ